MAIDGFMPSAARQSARLHAAAAGWRRLFDIHRSDPCAARPGATGLDRGGDRLLRSGKYRLHAAVAPVAHPAFEPQSLGQILGPHAETDALNIPAHNDMAYDAHPISPVSAGRAPR
jgi:hypothetical protein